MKKFLFTFADYAWRILTCNRLWLAVWIVSGLVDIFSGIGGVRPAKLWTWQVVISNAAYFIFILIVAYEAGRESLKRYIGRLKQALLKSEGQYRAMLEMNKTMIDDVSLAHKAGLPVKTFLYGHGMGDAPPVRDPADAPGVAL